MSWGGRVASGCVGLCWGGVGGGSYSPSSQTSSVAPPEKQLHLLPSSESLSFPDQTLSPSFPPSRYPPSINPHPFFHPILLSPLCQLSLRQSVTLCSANKGVLNWCPSRLYPCDKAQQLRPMSLCSGPFDGATKAAPGERGRGGRAELSRAERSRFVAMWSRLTAAQWWVVREQTGSKSRFFDVNQESRLLNAAFTFFFLFLSCELYLNCCNQLLVFFINFYSCVSCCVLQYYIFDFINVPWLFLVSQAKWTGSQKLSKFTFLGGQWVWNELVLSYAAIPFLQHLIALCVNDVNYLWH